MSFPQAVTTRRKGRWAGWSYSKLKNWRTCPKRHYHQEIAKDFKEGENEHMLYGNAVHKAFEERIRDGKPMPDHFDPEFETWAQKILKGSATAAVFEAEGKGRVLVEQQLAITEAFEPCQWFDNIKQVWARAKVDVLKISGPVALAIDWKTGKVADEQDQLMLCAQMVFSHHPQVQRIRLMYVWLKDGADTVLDISRDDMPAWWSGIIPEINRYKTAVQTMDFPPKPGFLCGKYCNVTTCQYNERGR